MPQVDFVRFLPITQSEVMAKKANNQFEKRLETQIRGIEQEQRYTKNMIEKSSTAFQHNANKARIQHGNQSCVKYLDSGNNGEYFIQLNRKKSKDDMHNTKRNLRLMPRLTMMCDPSSRRQTKSSFFHRGLTRSSSDNHMSASAYEPTQLPKRLTRSSTDGNDGDRLSSRVRSATVMDPDSLHARYSRWCDSLQEESATKSDNDDSCPPERSAGRRRSATVADIAVPEYNEMTDSFDVDDNTKNFDLPRLQQNQQRQQPPPFRRQRKLCRVLSLPESARSPRDFSPLRDDERDVLPWMVEAASKSIVIKEEVVKKETKKLPSVLPKHKSTKKAWHEAEDVLLKTTHEDKTKLRQTKSLQ